MKTVFPRYGFFLVVTLFTLTALDSSVSFARKETPQIVKVGDSPAAAPREGNLIPEQILGQWNFEGSAQGWTAVDATAQAGTFTHVDNFVGLALPYAPLNGTKSLWCGLKPGANCAYLLLPGYGNSWDQRFTSVSFPSSGGDVFVDFYIRYDTEPTYDNVTLEYQQTPGGVWTTVDTFTGLGNTGYTSLIPDAQIGATFRVRFRFVSDGAFSDEDGNFESQGAYVIDNLVVRDSGGTIDSQTFETESPGALTTADGDWTATGSTPYGVHAALFSGATVLQEDPGITNLTQLWGFFNNSTADYGCQGHPEQPAVPYGKLIDGEQRYLNNEIWSPPINILQDINGLPVSGTISMSADIYRGMTLDALVFYRYRVRSLVVGCWQRWLGNGTVYYSPDKTWSTHTLPISAQIAGGASQIQVAVGVLDMCPVWCGVFGSGACHSHGPLVDNVKVTAPGSGFLVVTNTNDSGAGSLRQAILDANANADFSGIVFEIPGAGPHVIAPFSELPAITQRVVIDGYSQAGAAPNTNGPLQGNNAVIKIVLAEPSLGNGLTISANQCTIRGLAIRDLPGFGIIVNGANNIITGCYIGLDADGTTVGSVLYGVSSSGIGTRIGGESPGDRNVISSCSVAGVFLAGADCTVENNFLGTDATGTLDRGSIQGIRVVATSSTIIGNLISGNSDGILMASNPSDAIVTSNRIGTDVTGTSGIGNTTGIRVHPQGVLPAPGFVTIGLPFEGNEIAFNSGEGIVLSGNSGLPGVSVSIEHNEIHSNGKGVVMPTPTTPGSTFGLLTRNSIHSNTGLGIDLLDNGLTANDVGDVDSGPNGLQNFPVITSVSNLAGGGVSISGTLNSTGGTDFAIECYASPSCDASGYGEGTLPIDVVVATTTPVGNANFNLQSPAGIPGGWYVTATATHAIAGTTSEFSQCVQYVNTPIGNPLVVPVDVATLESPVELTFQNVTNPGNTSIVIGDTGPPPPGSLSFGDSPTFYELSTTATFTGSITICIEYDEDDFTVPEASLQLMHYNGTSWVDITTSVDPAANVICGTTTSLSPFAIAQPNGPTSVKDGTPEAYALHPCAPNPFNPSTTIRYDVPKHGTQVSIAIFDVTGRRIRTLVDGAQPAGTRSTTWDGRDDRGQSVASGVYFYRMLADQFMQTRKMVLLK